MRSFADVHAPGSTIDDESANDSLVPSFILKPNQLLVSITPRDLSFVVEENLRDIFRLFAEHRVRIDLMQNSAVAFSVVVDDTARARATDRRSWAAPTKFDITTAASSSPCGTSTMRR